MYVGPKDNKTSGELTPLRVAGAAVALTAATAEFVSCAGFESIAVKTAGTEAAQRDVEVYAVLEIQ